MKNKKSKKNNRIALYAFLLSIPIVIFGAIEFFSNRNESITIEKLKINDKYIHVYEVTKTREKVYISQVVEWQKLRIGNKSKFPITITNSYIKIDDRVENEMIQPFFKKVKYENDIIEISEPLKLPLTIESNNVEEFYLLLNIPIDPSMGLAFFKTSFDTTYLSKESIVSTIFFNKNYFDDFEKIANEQIANSALTEVLKVEATFELGDKIPFRRPLIKEDSGVYKIIDENNQASDGFKYLQKDKCLFELNEVLLRNSLPIKSNFEKIEICFKTLKDNEYESVYLDDDFWK